MQPMNEAEQTKLKALAIYVEKALWLLPENTNEEDIQVAIARLENWLTENKGRWVK